MFQLLFPITFSGIEMKFFICVVAIIMPINCAFTSPDEVLLQLEDIKSKISSYQNEYRQYFTELRLESGIDTKNNFNLTLNVVKENI